jgi:hypothetical protein
VQEVPKRVRRSCCERLPALTDRLCNPPPIAIREAPMRVARSLACRVVRHEKRYLMTMIEIIEVHERAPIQ